MSNDSKRISELGITTTLANNDRVVVLTNPNTSAQTQTITLKNLANSIIANLFPIANATQLGVIKIGAGLSVAANGVVTAPLPLANTNAAGVVQIGSGINVNGNGVISVTPTTIPSNVSYFTNDSGYITANDVSANTGDITFSNSIIATSTGDDIVIIANAGGSVYASSNDRVEMIYTENGTIYGNGSPNITLFYASHADIGTYIKHFDANVGIDGWSEQRWYANGSLSHVGITNSYSFSWEMGPLSDGYSLGIIPSAGYINRLAITPTGDYDIHLWESSTNGAITLGNYGATNFRVYGSGGANGGGGQYGNDIRAELYGNASFTITSNNGNYAWILDEAGSLTAPYQYINNRTGYGHTLKLGDNTRQIAIVGAETTNDNPVAQRLVIAGADGSNTGEGGDIYLWAGRSGLNGGSGGDIKVDAGQAYNGSEGGTIKIRAGQSDTGTGGFVEIWSGYGSSGADIRNYTWNNTTNQWNQWTLSSNGNLVLPSNGSILDQDGSSPLRDIPQKLHSSATDYTLQLSDRGKHVLVQQNYAVIVPDNGTVAFPRGTAVVVVSGAQNAGVLPAAGSNTVIYNNGTQVFSNSSVDQGFFITPYTMATLLKVEDDTWILSAPNLQTGW